MRKKLDKPIWIPGHDGPRQITEFVMPDGPKIFGKPKNFEKALQRMKATGQISLDDFNNTAEIGAFIDFYNQMNEQKMKARTDEHIHDISLSLVKMMTRTMISMSDHGKPKVIKKKDLPTVEKPVDPVVDSPKKG